MEIFIGTKEEYFGLKKNESMKVKWNGVEKFEWKFLLLRIYNLLS